MAQVRIEVVTFEPGAQMVTGGVIQSQTITLAAEGDTDESQPVGATYLQGDKGTGVYGNTISGNYIAYIRVLSGEVAWRKDSEDPNTDPMAADNPLEMKASIQRTSNHDAIPVKVYHGDVFSFLCVAV